MTAKEYLIGAINIERLINAKRRTLKKLKLQSKSLSSPILGDKVKSSNSGNMSAVEMLIDLEREIEDQERQLIEKQKEIINRIQLVYNPTLIAVLTDHYINGHSLAKIAEDMEVSERTVCVWHGQALQIFRRETGYK